MALPKKSLRKITVGKQHFAWIATGNDEFIGLNIKSLDSNGQALYTNFRYHSQVVDSEQDAQGNITRWRTRQQLVVTPYIVRQVIEYALQHGWRPDEKGELALLGIEDHLDLRLGKGISAATH